jgi:[Skp1-protein]-hydroxyproline N-acetylglucosaminyltransferase
MTRISKQSLHKHHSNQGQKNLFACLAVFAVFFCFANLLLGAEYSPQEDASLLKFLKRTKKQSASYYQSQQIEECLAFPASIHKEEFQEIEHPVSAYKHWEQNVVKEEQESIPRKFMKIPRFYATGHMREYLGNYGERLMSKQQADSIGSHIFLNKLSLERVPEACYNLNSKTATSPDIIKLETINIMIASFRDGTMCKNTLQGLFQRARYPQRVRVTIVDQVLPESSTQYHDPVDDHPCTTPLTPCDQDPSQILCLYGKQIDPLPFNALDSSGPVTSRHLSNRLYRGEYFAMQCDSHVEFTKHWDTEIIEEWRSTNNELAILSVYPDQAYQVNQTTGERLTRSRAIMCSTVFEDGDEVGKHLRHDQEPCSLPDFKDMQQQLQPLWAAGFSFGRGHFVVNVPYDLYLPNIFQGEESNIGIRAFSYGYDLYAPSQPIVYHYYGPKTKSQKKVNVKKKKKLKFWDLPTYDDDVALQAMQRLNAIIELGMNDNEGDVFPTDLKEYGIGQVRTTEKYYKTFGFHRETETMEPNLCMYVASKAMNLRFLPALRKDTMGIDYNHENLVNWEFKDVWPCPDYWWKDGSCSSSDSKQSESED